MMLQNFINNISSFFSTWGVIAIKLLLLLGIGLMLIKLALKITNKIMAKNQVEKTARRFFYNLIKFVLYTVLAILMLNATGISTTTFIIILTLVATTTAIAFMKSLVNLASGLAIITTKQIKEHEEIEAGGIKGVISEIKLTHTIIKTKNNEEIVVPNKLFLEKPITKTPAQPKKPFNYNAHNANHNQTKKHKHNTHNKQSNKKENQTKSQNSFKHEYEKGSTSHKKDNQTKNQKAERNTETKLTKNKTNEPGKQVNHNEKHNGTKTSSTKEYLDYTDEVEVIEEVEIINTSTKKHNTNQQDATTSSQQTDENGKQKSTVKTYKPETQNNQKDKGSYSNNYKSAKQGIKKSKFGFLKTKKSKNKKTPTVIKK